MAERITSGDTVTQAAPSTGDPNRRSLTEVPAAWDRYEILELLGVGGMGKVLKARDRRLNRYVALKLIREDDPALVGRFFREAESQAKIDHANICKVYEVGEVGGTPYIAMQYIAGESLKAEKAALTLAQKLSVMIDVCSALHAAHEAGLIHRDIKPANIMIERGASGDLRPSVLDFGLAREVRSAETWSGSMEGTPAYMAPEQARGSPLDRRTDVYGLGATLYDLIAGRPPYVGATSVEVILALAFEEVPRLRSIEPSTPTEVDLIVMKCLDRDPARRYATARALADDLTRYLQGEPVEARPATLGYVLAKKAKKHKAFVAISLLALLAVTIAASFALRARLRAAEQAELAQELGGSVKGVELFMAYARALPRHDTRREKALMRAQIGQIDHRMRAGGAVAEGPCHYAVGRGLFVLGDPDEALRRFEEAWASGYRTADVDLWMGLTLGALYTRKLHEAQRIGDGAQREAERRRAEERYLIPALDRLSRASASSPAYTKGIIALYRGEHDAALERANEALVEAPWRYEAIALAGDVHHAKGIAAQNKADYESAMTHYQRAVEAYLRAQEMARSDAELYDREAESWTHMMEIALLRGDDPGQKLDRVLTACDRALEIDPDLSGVRAKKALAHFRSAIDLRLRAKDKSAAIAKAIEEAKRAIDAEPQDWIALETLGSAEIMQGEDLSQRGGDPSEHWRRGGAALQRAVAINPNFAWGWNDLGLTHLSIAEHKRRRGRDPNEDINEAIALLHRAAEIDPIYPFPHLNICFGEEERAQYEVLIGASPRASLERALASCETGALLVAPSPEVRANVAVAHVLLAEHLSTSGADPTAEIALALDAAASALDIEPSHVESLRLSARAHLTSARYEIAGGLDPTPSFERSWEAITTARAAAPEDRSCLIVASDLSLTHARWVESRGGDPTPLLTRALAAVERSPARGFGDPEVLRVEAELLAAMVTSPRGRGTRMAQIHKGITAAERAIQGNPLLAGAHAALGRLSLAEARETGAKDAAARAKAAFTRALSLSPHLAPELTPLLAEASR